LGNYFNKKIDSIKQTSHDILLHDFKLSNKHIFLSTQHNTSTIYHFTCHQSPKVNKFKIIDVE